MELRQYNLVMNILRRLRFSPVEKIETMEGIHQERAGFLNDETKPASFSPRHKLHKRRGQILGCILFYVTVTSLGIGTLFLAFQIHTQLSSVNPNPTTISTTEMTLYEASPCGTNAIEARNLGCEFDPLTFAWLPPQCYDYNLTAEFLSLQDWAWYRAKPDGTQRQLSLVNVMQSSDETLYVTWEYHRQHCVYLWLKMHRAVMVGKPVDGVSMLDIITGVCEGVLRDKRDKEDRSVPGYVKFPSCKVY